MNILDILLILPLLWGLYRGFRKGLVHQLSTFLALFLGVYGALHFSGVAEPYLVTVLGEEPEQLPLIAFAITFLVILIAVHLIGRMIDRLVRFVALGVVNRILGAAFGFLKMALFMLALSILLRSFGPEGGFIPEDTRADSVVLSELDRIAEEAMRYELGEEWSFEGERTER